jgi:hypothetical protein
MAGCSCLSVDPMVFLGVDSSVFPKIRLRLLEVSIGLRRAEIGLMLFRISCFEALIGCSVSGDEVNLMRSREV